MTKEIKAIETEYNGYKFRSRLEARWGVFFDSLGIKYEYEPEGFELSNGQWYLPDFKIRVRDYRLFNGYYVDYGFGGCEPNLEFVSSERINGTLYELYKNSDNTLIRFACDSEDVVTEVDYVEYDLFIEVKGNMTDEDLNKIEEFSKHKNILVLGNIPTDFNNDSYVDDIYFNNRFITNAYKDLEKFEGCTFENVFLRRDKKGIAEVTNELLYCVDEIPYEIARKVRFEHGQTPTADVVRKYGDLLYHFRNVQLQIWKYENVLEYWKKETNKYEKRFYGKE